MAKNMSILVGTIGQGIMRSADGGDSWRRVGIDQGLHSDALVRCLSNLPGQPETVFAGTDKGLYRSGDAGQSWQRVDSPLNEYCVWAMAVDPARPDTMYAVPQDGGGAGCKQYLDDPCLGGLELRDPQAGLVALAVLAIETRAWQGQAVI